MPIPTRKEYNKVVKLILLGMLIQLAVIVYVAVNAHDNNSRLRDSQRAGCERGKIDRMDNAEFQKAHTKYILSVTGAKSVKEDVKTAAREAAKTFVRTSESLLERARIDCEKAFP